MDGNLKRKFTSIGKIEYFQEIIKKLTIGSELRNEEKTYILACAILFSKAYERDRRHKSFLEIAYYIILKYSILSMDYQPLYDFSINFGFYPITDSIIRNNLIETKSIQNFLVETNIDKYKNGEIIETFEQFKTRTEILIDESKEVSYIAPTSFGKSSIILEHLENNPYNRIGVIVPTKSLLNQTYRMIKNKNPNYRLIIHDDMYDEEVRFIGILTQERALRLLEKDSFYFDILYIDEAHNLLKKNDRSILLSRLIRKSNQKNPNQKILYLSPLINNSDNLKIDNEQNISSHKIIYNVKEPEYYDYRLDGQVYKYNRFIGNFYFLGRYDDFYSYIRQFSRNKTFIYHRRPVYIERFSKTFSEYLPLTERTSGMDNLISILQTYVHSDFYMINLIRKGIIYLHAKLPEQIKDFLEYKYKNMPELRYVIANSVILEGINLPIETLHILNTYSLNEADLTNLIGRVNRLNDIFNNTNSLELLFPQVHFVNTNLYNNCNMTTKIQALRSNVFKDEIDNPILCSYDLEKESRKEELKEKNTKIREEEAKFLDQPSTEQELLRHNLIKFGVARFYTVDDNFIEELLKRIRDVENLTEWSEMNIIDKMHKIFIEGIDNINEYEIKRLTEERARDYYKMFIDNSKKSLNENINLQFRYFKSIQNIPRKNTFYFGVAYGEVSRDSIHYPDSNRNVYINLNEKTDKELINLVIVKIKMEEDFVSFTLNNFFNLMLELNLITAEEHNLTIYGTNDTKKLRLMKIGLPINVVTRLENDNQVENISFDHNNNIQTNQEFERYKETQDEFFRFKLNKFL